MEKLGVGVCVCVWAAMTEECKGREKFPYIQACL